MTNQELLEEIRINRSETQELHKEIAMLRSDLSLFKGKAFGFMAVVSVIINIGIAGINLLKDKG